ncbi:porin [Polynucleobacter sp.]|jgi:predicted porin|uniref:porin n=1 Tax=Polynucleobacter sp. TaxID=2029855 RepID=UPI00258BCA41|nr:porin [Polynucleobacter sp.]MCX7238250.1 porin [Polynucleobacter sp.]
MKKSLLAVAAIGAFASAAQAQSSVTVYGILDVGYIGSNAREGSVSSSKTMPSGTAVNPQQLKVQKSAFGQSAEQTSRLGFKGTEDLGGGASAFFTVELGLTPQNSELSGGTAEDRVQRTTNGSGSAVDNRQSFVGLKKNGIGQFAFGRQYTPVFNTGAATSPGQYNNVVGDVVYVGASSAYGAGTNVGGGNNNGAGFTNRASNAFTAQSDRFAGFQVGGLYALNNQNSTQLADGGVSNSTTTFGSAGGNTNWNGWGLNGNFTWQKLYVGVAYQSFKTQYNTGVMSSWTAANLNSVGATSGQVTYPQLVFPAAQISDKQTLVGATYDFGILKAYAQWVGRKVQNDYTTPGYASGAAPAYAGQPAASASGAGEQLNRNAQQIGVRSYITPTIESWASVGTGKIKATAGGSSANFFGYQLGSNYYLSKRTNLYAIYGQSQTTSNSVTAGVGAGANQYAVGVRHTF